MTVGDDIQLAVELQAATGVVEHFPGNVIRQRMLLMERRVAQYGVKAKRLNPGQRVVNHKLTAIDGFRQVSFHIQTAGRHRHWGFIDKHHARLRIFFQQRQTNYPVATAEIDNLPFQILWQVLHKETCANIQPGAGEDVGMVVDGPVGAFQFPAQRFRRIGQSRLAEGAIDETRLFPRQRGSRWTEHFLKQLQRGVMDIPRLRASNDTGLRGHHFSQRAQLLLKQCQRFRHFDQHHVRRLRVLCRAVEKLDAGLREVVMAQVFPRCQFA